MVLKTELCRFSGQKIYLGRGIRFIRSDSQVFLFINSKCKRYFHNKLKPSKLTCTESNTRRCRHFNFLWYSGLPRPQRNLDVTDLQREGKDLPKASLPFHRGMPSMTHMALVQLERAGILKFVISQVYMRDFEVETID